MAYIECCGHKVHALPYYVLKNDDSLQCTLKIAEKPCPHCGKSKIELEKIGFDCEIRHFQYSGAKAQKLLGKLKNLIIPLAPVFSSQGTSFYLNYSEYGKTKKCYSNLSTLKLGIFDFNDFLKYKQTLIA